MFGIDVPKMCRVVLVTDVPFVRTVDDSVETPVGFIGTLYIVASRMSMIRI